MKLRLFFLLFFSSIFLANVAFSQETLKSSKMDICSSSPTLKSNTKACKVEKTATIISINSKTNILTVENSLNNEEFRILKKTTNNGIVFIDLVNAEGILVKAKWNEAKRFISFDNKEKVVTYFLDKE